MTGCQPEHLIASPHGLRSSIGHRVQRDISRARRQAGSGSTSGIAEQSPRTFGSSGGDDGHVFDHSRRPSARRPALQTMSPQLKRFTRVVYRSLRIGALNQLYGRN